MGQAIHSKYSTYEYPLFLTSHEDKSWGIFNDNLLAFSRTLSSKDATAGISRAPDSVKGNRKSPMHLHLGCVRLTVFRNRNTWNKKSQILRFYGDSHQNFKHLLRWYFKHIFIILAASKRWTYRFNSSLQAFLFRNRVNRTHHKGSLGNKRFVGFSTMEDRFTNIEGTRKLK